MSSGTPAGWYTNPDNPATNRYWDGGQWTDHTMPVPAPPVPTPPPPATQTAPTAPLMSSTPPAPSVPAGNSNRKWIIGGAVVAGVLVVGAVGQALAGGRDDKIPAAAPTVTVTAEAEPAPEPEPTADVAEPTPEAEETVVADPVAFKAQAGSHLDDMNKDLGDMVTTVAEDGFWRLLSNTVELSFNIGQLKALDVPEKVAGDWAASLTALEEKLDELSDAVTSEDKPTILAAVDAMAGQVEATRAVADTAE